MTREIKTPADAVPVVLNFDGDEITIFTAAECAQIAETYLDAYCKERAAIWGREKEYKKAEAELKAWRAKFKEWQST